MIIVVELVIFAAIIYWMYLGCPGPRESADEVATAGWKPGDGCVAVFRPERPDIATFRPRPAA